MDFDVWLIRRVSYRRASPLPDDHATFRGNHICDSYKKPIQGPKEASADFALRKKAFFGKIPRYSTWTEVLALCFKWNLCQGASTTNAAEITLLALKEGVAESKRMHDEAKKRGLDYMVLSMPFGKSLRGRKRTGRIAADDDKVVNTLRSQLLRYIKTSENFEDLY